MKNNKKFLIHLLSNKSSLFISLFFYPLYSFLGLLRKIKLINGKYYILSASSGNLINDNSKYLLLQYRNNNKFIYLVKNKKMFQFKDKYKLNIEYFFSFKSIYYMIYAKNFFISHGTYDLSPIFMKNVDVIQLWHGIPLKKIVNDVSRSNSIFKKIIFKIYPHLNYSYCDKLFVGGERCMLNHAFQKKKAECINIGFPRYLAFDRLFFNLNSDILLNHDIEYLYNYKKQGKKIIVYAPTYRSYDDTNNIIETMNSLQTIDNCIITYKGHTIGMNFSKLHLKNNNIYIYQDSDPYPLMNICDLLITDYSSLFIDYSITLKPFILYMYDYDFYKKNVGLYFNLKKEFELMSCFDIENLLKMAKHFLNTESNTDIFKSVKNNFISNNNEILFNTKKFEEYFL